MSAYVGCMVLDWVRVRSSVFRKVVSGSNPWAARSELKRCLMSSALSDGYSSSGACLVRRPDPSALVSAHERLSSRRPSSLAIWWSPQNYLSA